MSAPPSSEFRERLIDEVKRFPVLYDTRHERHRDIDVRDRCWADIAAKLGANCEVLKREWKILRDSFRQSLRKTRGGATTTRAGLPCKRWRFQQRMAYLLPHITKRTRHSHSLRAVMKLDAEGELSEPAEGEAGGDAGGDAVLGGEGGADSLELFFASVCAGARRLPNHTQRLLKRQVLDALLRCEAEADEPPAPAPRPADLLDEYKP